eukprot:6634190-Pyramimonas_sp.AAC.1
MNPKGVRSLLTGVTEGDTGVTEGDICERARTGGGDPPDAVRGDPIGGGGKRGQGRLPRLLALPSPLGEGGRQVWLDTGTVERTQSDAASAGIFSRWTNRTQVAREYSHDGGCAPGLGHCRMDR